MNVQSSSSFSFKSLEAAVVSGEFFLKLLAFVTILFRIGLVLYGGAFWLEDSWDAAYESEIFFWLHHISLMLNLFKRASLAISKQLASMPSTKTESLIVAPREKLYVAGSYRLASLKAAPGGKVDSGCFSRPRPCKLDAICQPLILKQCDENRSLRDISDP